MLKIAVDHGKGRLYQFRRSKYCRHGIDGMQARSNASHR